MPTDIPALIERLRAHCYCGSSKWLTEDRPESDLCDVCLAATALAEQGKALAAARVAEGEAMLVVEQQDREIARLERLCDLQQGQLTAEQDARDTACRQLAEAREVLVDIAHMAGDEKPNPKDYDGYHGCRVLGFNEGAWQAAQIARQWLASTEKQ